MINFGTVGTGWITESFIKAAELSGQFHLQAVYSRTEEKAKKLAESYNTNTFYTSIEEMAQSTEIEAVYIASPNSLHFEHALLFLKNKKHVICEKPICSNKQELEQAFQTAEENGVFLFEAIRNIHTPNFAILKENISKAGKLRSALLPYIQYSSRYDSYLKGEEPNIFSAAFSGGALVDLGVYPLFLAVGLFGEPQKVSYYPVKLRTGVDGSGTLIMEYEDYVCTIMCSKTSHSVISCEIHGEAGTFVLPEAAPISKIEFIDSHTKESEYMGIWQEEQDMIYEATRFAEIIGTKDFKTYEELKKLSKIVIGITEEARRQNGIVFGTEKE
jgi:predicted dehydrogenase